MGSNHKILSTIVVILIIGICGAVGYFILDKSGMKLSGNSTTDLKADSFDISITTSESENNISIEKTNIKVSGTFDDSNKEYKYKLKIKNKGTIDTYLYSIVVEDTNIDAKLLDGESELNQDKIIKANEDIDALLVVKSKTDENVDFDTNIKLVFNQYDE